jgi:hypothetical protein
MRAVAAYARRVFIESVPEGALGGPADDGLSIMPEVKSVLDRAPA